jgi:hypothetical protein
LKRENFGNIVKKLKGINDEILQHMFPETELPISYKEIMKDFYKNEIIEIAENWELKGIKSLNKQKIVEKIEEHIKSNIDKLLFNLDSETIEILKKIEKNSGTLEAEKMYTDTIDYFTSKGIAFPVKNSKKYYIYMPDEILKSLNTTAMKKHKTLIETNDRALNLIKGIMLNYGAVEREKFFEIMNLFMNGYEGNWIDAAKEYLIYESLFFSYENSFAIVPDEESANLILNEQLSRKNFATHIFNERELIESGKSGNPILNDIQIEFAVVIEKNALKNSKIVYEVLYEAINSINYGKKYEEILEEIMNIFGFTVETIIKDKEFTIYFSEFCNNTRQWILNGNTPNEMIEKNNASIREETESHFNTEKIGRNETCNCGSGKKYKKCCGK